MSKRQSSLTMRTLGGLATAFLLLISRPASAWERMKDDSDGNCAFGQVFDGPGSTVVLINQDQKLFDQGLTAVLISNDNWSIKAGDTIKETIKFEAEDYEFWSEPVAIDHGLLLFMNSEHVKKFSESHPYSVTVWKGDRAIDRLDFSGFWIEFVMFDACVEKKRRAKSERERLESIEKELPRDPFSD